MRKDRWFRILKFFSKRCDFWKFSNLRKVLKYNCFQNNTDFHKLNYFKILVFFLKSLLFERTHLLFENSSSPKNSSTFEKLIYFKTLIYFSETHLPQKLHLLLENSSTSKNSSTFQKLIYFKKLVYFSKAGQGNFLTKIDSVWNLQSDLRDNVAVFF